uniref:Uncharacterized protein n=1 Tax=Timema tahoe TaxID=61484 RepID=A0A7R9IFV9_9NEOP|nr:unnamed protein product [Timema tahoe]
MRPPENVARLTSHPLAPVSSSHHRVPLIVIIDYIHVLLKRHEIWFNTTKALLLTTDNINIHTSNGICINDHVEQPFSLVHQEVSNIFASRQRPLSHYGSIVEQSLNSPLHLTGITTVRQVKQPLKSPPRLTDITTVRQVEQSLKSPLHLTGITTVRQVEQSLKSPPRLTDITTVRQVVRLCTNYDNELGMRTVGFRGNAPAFALKES